MAAHALGKAREVAARTSLDARAILSADTTVLAGEQVLGKPSDRDDARRMLVDLAGQTHTVATAVCLIIKGSEHTFVDETHVRFRPYGAAQIAWYLERGEWQGRAGAYAIQGSGATLVAGIEGDFTTVVGLPMARLLDLMQACGLAPWSDAEGGVAGEGAVRLFG